MTKEDHQTNDNVEGAITRLSGHLDEVAEALRDIKVALPKIPRVESHGSSLTWQPLVTPPRVKQPIQHFLKSRQPFELP